MDQISPSFPLPGDPHQAAIYCHDLTRYYGTVRAVDGLTLSVAYGSVFGFLGRNGAGKTTTIRMLTGLAHPTRGAAWVAGIKTTDGVSAARRLFGYLPQDPAFYKWMTPVEYLDYCGRLFAMPPGEIKKRSAEILELVGLREASRRHIGGFSGGMIQRMGLAQALIHDPQVLILDEPTSSLDPAGRHEVLELIASLRGRVTVFLSSHILSDVERVCDTIAIIHNGHLVLVSDKLELMERYAASAVEMEFPQDHLPIPESLLNDLQNQPWVDGIERDQHRVRVAVTDRERGKRELLPLLARHGVVLDRYEWVRPTLEEIFLKISAR